MAILAVAFAGFGVMLLVDLVSTGASVGWDLTQGVPRGRLTGDGPAWSSILVEAILGPVFLLLAISAVRGAR